MGEDEYSVLFNNCEHFVNWCIEGEARSRQVRNTLLVLVGTGVLTTTAVGGRIYDDA